jgi:hypothetical protein
VFVLVVITLRRRYRQSGVGQQLPRPVPDCLPISSFAVVARLRDDRGCLYDSALAQLGGDIDAVQAALATFRRLGAKAAARRAQQP